MSFSALKNWLARQLKIGTRQTAICLWYLLFLMIATRKHTLSEASRFSGVNKSQFSRWLQNHSQVAVVNLDQLSKRQARQFRALIELSKVGLLLPWTIFLLIDSTLHTRSTRHTQNAQRFNHGKGFVIGHQWTNVVLVLGDMLIPLAPIPFYSKKYCRQHNISYKTENEAVVEYIQNLDLKEYVGPHDAHEVIVLADSGYDDRKIQNAIQKKKWVYVIALKKTRGVRSENTNKSMPLSRGWSQVESFFKDQRRIKWVTIRVPSSNPKKKRMEFRLRQITAYLRYVGKVQLICSEFKKRPKGRRKYLACNDLYASPREILMAYRARWKIELFHKDIKMYLGFQELGAKHFDSVLAHVHWVYCAYILLHALPVPNPEQRSASLGEKQRYVKAIVEGKEVDRIIQLLTQFRGVDRYKAELRAVKKTLYGQLK